MMEQYDEDLSQNRFFQELQQKCPSLYEEASDKRWVICVPRMASLGSKNFQPDDFENHVLLSDMENPSHFHTANDKVVLIKSSLITTAAGFLESLTVPVLFEETFFNRNDESFRVVCINQLLEGNEDIVTEFRDSPSYHTTLQNLGDCADLLWGNSGNLKTKRQMDDLISFFHKSIANASSHRPYKQLVQTAEGLFNKAVTMALKDPYLKRMSKGSQSFLDSVKLAIETYTMHGIYKRLFDSICTCLGNKDAQLNRITRNLTQVQLRDLGVRLDVCQNVPKARKELTNLSIYSTPLGKLNCLKRVVSALMQPNPANRTVALTTDDLLPILVFLVVKAEVPHWYSHFSFMSDFRFSKPSLDDEFGFYLATLEASLEHISTGKLEDLESHADTEMDMDFSLSASPDQRSDPWHWQETEVAAISTLFAYVKSNDKEAVKEFVSRGRVRPAVKSLVAVSRLCHPLCTCDRCRPLVSSSSASRSFISLPLHVRDARGFTVLHVAASMGYTGMADLLIKHGALVNSVDYGGATPLHVACQHGRQAVLLLLLHHGAFVNTRDNEGNTPLHTATLRGHDDCVKALIFDDRDNGHLDVNVTNDFGDSPLHVAARWGYHAILEVLLDNGGRAAVKNRKNQPPVFYTHNLHTAQLLRKHTNAQRQEPADRQESSFKLNVRKTTMSSKDAASTSQSLPFKFSTAGEQPPTDKQVPPSKYDAATHHASLQSAGPSSGGPTATDVKSAKNAAAPPPPYGSISTYSLGTRHPPKRKLSLLGNNTLQLNIAKATDQTAAASEKKIEKLLKAIACGDVQMAKHHLGWGSDSEDEDSPSSLPTRELCHPLCQCDKCHPGRKLTEAGQEWGVNINSCNCEGFTPLHVATQHGRLAMMELFIRQGANVEARLNTNESSPLHLACKHPTRKPLQPVEVLLRYGADVDGIDSQGNAALHYCCMTGHQGTTELLVKHKASVNLVNRQGNTPLHDAVHWNFLNIVSLLIASGANINCLNKKNKRPLDFAQTEEMYKVLRKAARRDPHNHRDILSSWKQEFLPKPGYATKGDEWDGAVHTSEEYDMCQELIASRQREVLDAVPSPAHDPADRSADATLSPPTAADLPDARHVTSLAEGMSSLTVSNGGNISQHTSEPLVSEIRQLEADVRIQNNTLVQSAAQDENVNRESTASVGASSICARHVLLEEQMVEDLVHDPAEQRSSCDGSEGRFAQASVQSSGEAKLGKQATSPSEKVSSITEGALDGNKEVSGTCSNKEPSGSKKMSGVDVERLCSSKGMPGVKSELKTGSIRISGTTSEAVQPSNSEEIPSGNNDKEQPGNNETLQGNIEEPLANTNGETPPSNNEETLPGNNEKTPPCNNEDKPNTKEMPSPNEEILGSNEETFVTNEELRWTDGHAHFTSRDTPVASEEMQTITEEATRGDRESIEVVETGCDQTQWSGSTGSPAEQWSPQLGSQKELDDGPGHSSTGPASELQEVHGDFDGDTQAVSCHVDPYGSGEAVEDTHGKWQAALPQQVDIRTHLTAQKEEGRETIDVYDMPNELETSSRPWVGSVEIDDGVFHEDSWIPGVTTIDSPRGSHGYNSEGKSDNLCKGTPSLSCEDGELDSDLASEDSATESQKDILID